MALSPEEINAIGYKLDMHNQILKLVLDMDSEDGEIIADALSQLNTFLEQNMITVKDIVESNLSTSLVNLLTFQDSLVLIELCKVIIQIYQQASKDQMILFCDLGIHSSITNLLEVVEEEVIPHVLYCICAMCASDPSEPENFSNNEIWPIIESLIQTFFNNDPIIKVISMVLSTLVKPDKNNDSSQQVMNGVLLLMDSLTHLLDVYIPNIRDDFVGDSTEKADAEGIVYNLYIVLYYFTCAKPSIEDYYDLFIAPCISNLIPLAVTALHTQFAVIGMKLLSNLVIISSEICQQIVDEGILDALADYLQERVERETRVPVYYARWLVLFLLSNLAVDSEEVIDLLLNSELMTIIHEAITNPAKNKGLFVEYIYLLSNMLFAASEEQKKSIAMIVPVGIVEGISRSGIDEEVCMLAETVMQLVEEVREVEQVDFDMAANVFDDMSFIGITVDDLSIASSYEYDAYEN